MLYYSDLGPTSQVFYNNLFELVFPNEMAKLLCLLRLNYDGCPHC